MSAPRAPRSTVVPNWPRIIALVVAVVVVIGLILWIGPCGDGDADATAAAGETWSERANAFCADGIQEATALTPPTDAAQVAADAEARIGIVATVRDGIYTLGEPPDLDPTLATVYLEGLNQDLDELDKVREAAGSDGDYESLNAAFDESSGETASKLDLTDCAAFAQAVASG